MKLMEAKRQRIWGWPAVVNFIFGGAGAGFYLMSAFHAVLNDGSLFASQPASAWILSPVLVCLGFLAVALEAGRPLRGIYLLSNLRSSWISIELFAGGLFIFSALSGGLFSSAPLHILAVCSALGFIISQGFVIYRSRAITAWNVPAIPVLFLLSALASGGGLLLLLSAYRHFIPGEGVLTVIVVILMAEMVVWNKYAAGSSGKDMLDGTRLLRTPLLRFLVTGLGHAAPLVMLTGLVITSEVSFSPGSQPVVSAMSGLSILAGGVVQKTGILLGADFLRAVEMGLPRDHARTEKLEGATCRTGGAAECEGVSSVSLKK